MFGNPPRQTVARRGRTARGTVARYPIYLFPYGERHLQEIIPRKELFVSAGEGLMQAGWVVAHDPLRSRCPRAAPNPVETLQATLTYFHGPAEL